MSDIMLFILGTALANNIIVVQIAGVDPALAFSKRQVVAKGLCLTLLILLPVATLFTFIMQHAVLLPLDISYLQLPMFVTLIILLASLLKILLPKINGALGERIDVFLPMAAVNTTLLGTVLFNLRQSDTVMQSVAYGLVTALGFALVLLMITSIREKLEYADIPLPFRGLSITLVTLGLMAMAFMGFPG